MRLRLQVKVNKTADLSGRNQNDTYFRNKSPRNAAK